MIYDIFLDIMYVDDYRTVINGKKYRRALIRESYREGEKVNKRPIANIAHASDSQIEAIKVALKNSDEIVTLKNTQTVNFTSSGKSVGSVAMLYQIAQIFGITKALGKSGAAILFLWFVKYWDWTNMWKCWRWEAEIAKQEGSVLKLIKISWMS
ncbi:MAG: hypothetical protein JSV88_30680 [Candidatus Aminicenantes bacterium]|nr:MAG: hypothetical protein JSV88_30680 [Candidatus Aminicenantes bacterium]